MHRTIVDTSLQSISRRPTVTPSHRRVFYVKQSAIRSRSDAGTLSEQKLTLSTGAPLLVDILVTSVTLIHSHAAIIESVAFPSCYTVSA